MALGSLSAQGYDLGSTPGVLKFYTPTPLTVPTQPNYNIPIGNCNCQDVGASAVGKAMDIIQSSEARLNELCC